LNGARTLGGTFDSTYATNGGLLASRRTRTSPGAGRRLGGVTLGASSERWRASREI
jgi:hypothetical protein